jgi:hypothetical protein
MAANNSTLSKSSFRNSDMIKAIIGVSVVVVALPAIGLIREYIAYKHYERKLENVHRQIHLSMSTEDVKLLVGEPDSKMQRGSEETWYWFAGDHQGRLWKLLKLTTVKGHYDLTVTFSIQGRVVGIWGGVN